LTTIYGQNSDFRHKKDSLLKAIASTQGEEKLKLYRNIGNKLEESMDFSDEEVDLMLQYTSDFIREARKQQNKKYECDAYEAELRNLYNFSRIDEFERKANEYLLFCKKNGFQRNYYYVYSFLLSTSNLNGIEGIKKMYEEAKQENCLYGIAEASVKIASLYYEEKRFDEAEKYFRETITNASKLIKENPNEVVNYYLISNGYDGLIESLLAQKKINNCTSLMSDWKKYAIDFEKTFNIPYPYLTYYYKACAAICIKKEKYDEAELYCDSMKLLTTSHIEEGFIWDLKATICEKRGEYECAIDWLNKSIEYNTNVGQLTYTVGLLNQKARILSEMGRAKESYSVSDSAFQLNDSLRLAQNNLQLDEVRTRYEVDKYIAEKEHNFNYLLFAISGCILLAIALGIWIYLNRKISKKNRTLAQQIKELTTQHEEQINEMLTKTSFLPHSLNETTSVADSDLCIESRIDKLCITIRDFLFKDKIYRNSNITQETVIKTLGTNKDIFSKAFNSCFKMRFKDYVNFLRMKDAIHLLEHSDLSIEEISELAGFGTVQTFRRQFNEEYNMAPKDYRSSIKKNNNLPL
jgi:AraC-like DNA-binding protein